MVHKSTSSLLLLIIAASAITGCASNGSSFPTGVYIDGEGHISNYMEGGSFTVSLSNGTVLVEDGRYSVDGDIITMTDDFCPPVDGVYKWTNQGGSLLFELVEDECDGRASTLDNAVLEPLDTN